MEGAVAPTAPSSLLRPGKMFVNPLFDYLLIGGIVSWIAGGIIYGAGVRYNEADLFWVLLVSNWAHFAASTVRLYTKPDAVRTWPFLTLAFPVVTIAVVSAVVALGEPAGRYFFALYFLWSPFHYSAQAYGLSVMYAYRSGTTLAPMDRTLIRWTCLLPFFWTLLQPQGGLGLVLRFVLFQNWPQLYWLAGYDIGRATLLVVAVINIHHFIVDAFIWKLRRDPNYKNVVDVPASVVAV